MASNPLPTFGNNPHIDPDEHYPAHSAGDLLKERRRDRVNTCQYGDAQIGRSAGMENGSFRLRTGYMFKHCEERLGEDRDLPAKLLHGSGNPCLVRVRHLSNLFVGRISPEEKESPMGIILDAHQAFPMFPFKHHPDQGRLKDSP